MLWFVASFTTVLVVGIAWSHVIQPWLEKRGQNDHRVITRRPAPEAVKQAERAVYDARSEEEHVEALRELFELLSSESSEGETDDRATG